MENSGWRTGDELGMENWRTGIGNGEFGVGELGMESWRIQDGESGVEMKNLGWRIQDGELEMNWV